MLAGAGAAVAGQKSIWYNGRHDVGRTHCGAFTGQGVAMFIPSIMQRICDKPPMTPQELRLAAKAFVSFWTGKGCEKGQTLPFWAHPDCSLKILYDELTMPPGLRRAHQENEVSGSI